jgi:hypothetical protein
MVMSVIEEKTRERQRCRAIRKDGQPCNAFAVVNGYCIGHSPAAAEARSKGGRNSSNAARLAKMIPARLRPTLDLLETAIQEVHKGTLQPQRGTAMASLASAMIKVFETGVLEERLLRLEVLIKKKGGRANDT